jgi:hypothetical protein
MTLWLGLAIALASGSPGSPDPGIGHYTVRAGDRLAILAQTGFVGRGAVAKVLRLNHIRSPRRLRPGQVLRIPRDVLRDEGSYATVETYSGPVALFAHGNPLPTRTGVALGEGARIRTGRNGFITLRLGDNTAVTLPSQTDVSIARLRRVVLTGALEREFALADGRAHMTVTPMTVPESNFRVVTPISVSAVRGTDFRVAFAAAAQTAATEVDEGRVSVGRLHGTSQAIQGKPALVAAGAGLSISARGAGLPTKLPPPPTLENPGLVQSGEQLDFRVTPNPGTAAFRAQISHDAGALDVIAETMQDSPDVVFPSISAGSWFLRLTSIDAQGIEGTAQTYAFDRYRNQVSGTMIQSALRHHHHAYQFKWNGIADGTLRYRFRLWLEGRAGTPTIDEAGLRSNALDVRDLAPGTYHWQIGATILVGGRAIESRSADQSFQIARPR